MIRKVFKFIFVGGLFLGLIAAVAGVSIGLHYYNKLTSDLPRIERISDYQPKSVSRIFASDGTTLMGEEYEELRYPVSFEQIPEKLKQAFLSAEDANFYSHPGIDLVSIMRAVWANLRHKRTVQGGSTITQQVVKSLLLTREKTYERKAKEAILSYRLEQALSKDEILEIYLNEIYLGSRTYGISAAAKVHFRKELADLSLAEIAYLAGLPPKPSYLANPKNRQDALDRQRYVLKQMYKNGYITSAELEEAASEDLQIYPPKREKTYAAPYFTTHVTHQLKTILGDKLTKPGGYTVVTTADIAATELAEASVQRGLREVDKRRGWRGPVARVKLEDQGELLDSKISQPEDLKQSEIYRAIVKSTNPSKAMVAVQVGAIIGYLDLEQSKWAERLFIREIRDEEEDYVDIEWQKIDLLRYLSAGDVIEVSFAGKTERDDYYFKVDQTPEVQGAFVAQNTLTGEVVAIVGGYDFRRSQFNRASQGLRQPGSSFKPFIYLAALEYLAYTAATIVPDSPISLLAGDGEIWNPQNYDKKFLGPITLRTALQRSRNVVSVFMIDQMGVDKVVDVARAFGISTPIPRILSLALGAGEVKLIEMVRAYGAFASGGWLADQITIKEIRDRKGNIVFQKRPKHTKVANEDTTFILVNMLKGVVERGTARKLRALGRPVAGKTGTTNEQMDAWFIGFTPEWTAGAWVGFDVKKTIGRYETGGKAAAPIFLYFMQEFLKDKMVLDFDNIPDGIIPVKINLASGALADEGDPSAFTEYFKIGTEPKYKRRDRAVPQDYLSSEEF